MFKKTFVLLFFLFFLFSCWEEDTSTESEWLKTVDKTEFSISVPSNWEIINNTEDILPKPNKWNIELAVASNIAKLWFKNNLLILSDDLNSFTNSKDFSMLNNLWASKDYIDYTALSSKDFTFADEEQSILYTFEAKYNYDSPKLKFLQTAHICNQTKAFFFTIAIPASVIDTSKYEFLLQSFKCNNVWNTEL